MEAIKIRKHLNSETIHFPELKNFIGEDVEFIILVKSQTVMKNSEISNSPKRIPGSAKGMIEIADDFEAPLDAELIAEFYK